MKDDLKFSNVPSNAIFLACSSHEERCLGVANRRSGWKPEKVVLFHYDDHNPRREVNHADLRNAVSDCGPVIELPLSERDVADSLRQRREAISIVLSDSEKRSVVVDISVLTKRHLLMLLRWFDDHELWDRLWIVYTEPEEYEIDGNLPLSFGISRVEQVPGFSASPDASRPLHVAMFLGYEGDRAFATYELLQPRKTTLIVPDPPFREAWQGRTEKQNQNLLSVVDSTSVVTAGSLDPGSSFSTLEHTFGSPSVRSEFARVLCPLGTKPQIVGAYFVSAARCGPTGSGLYRGIATQSQLLFERSWEELVDSSPELVALPTRIDRYPAKMISRLASSLVERFASDADHLLDPFCGSGAVLRAGGMRGIPVTGLDLNPFGVLLSEVKMQGFDVKRAEDLCDALLEVAHQGYELPVVWDMKDYWFTPATLRKYERLRHAAQELSLNRSKAGRAVLLALALSVRPCSRADQRSPKPFISKHARANRKGTHYDPAKVMRSLLAELCDLYGGRPGTIVDVHQCDLATNNRIEDIVTQCSHVITSPPYVNAQDYFRNSKLELYMLEGLLPFSIDDIIHRFIGTERGLTRDVLEGVDADERRRLEPKLAYLERCRAGHAVVLHRYLGDMRKAFDAVKRLLCCNGTLVVVCGDNLIGGRRILTWRILNAMLEQMGFVLFESFGDQIKNRAVAPMRSGHKGLIKQEMISAFTLG